MTAVGWYRDPFERHEERWFSEGRPTALVKDGSEEAHDPPPAEAWAGELVRAASPAPGDPDDLRRVSDPEPSDGYGMRAMEVWSRFLPPYR